MKKVKVRGKEPKVPYRPRLSGVFEGYVYNFVAHQWRTSRLYKQGHDFDDLLQEAACVFFVCRERYGDVVDNPRWFMALFTRALFNHFVDLKRQSKSYDSLDEIADHESMRPQWTDDSREIDTGYYMRVLHELPADLQDLLRAFSFGDDSVLPALKRGVLALAT